MKWKRTKSRDVIDVRGAPKGGRSGGFGGLGGGGGMPLPGGMAGLGGGAGLIVVLVIVALQLFGGGDGEGGGFDIGEIFGPAVQAPGADDPDPIPRDQDPQVELKDFSTYVFEDSQDTWRGTFDQGGEGYDNAQLVLYDGAVSTGGCGGATSAVGPFYCPADQRVYLDLSFYEDMQGLVGASDEIDFAWAYVIAHEMGHHVQNVSGTNDQVSRLERGNPGDANELSVRVELQADCYAGVWASTVFDQLEAGDLDEAFTASEAIGDDRLQARAGGRVDPDSFTHGTSEQRRTWFENGYESGDPAACDTFSADEL